MSVVVKTRLDMLLTIAEEMKKLDQIDSSHYGEILYLQT